MKKVFYSLFVCLAAIGCAPAIADTFSCGAGYVLVEHNKIDGITAQACEKLWCKDLETGQSMGAGNTPANGYRATAEPVTLRVNEFGTNNVLEIKCFGERKWCAGEVEGEWMHEYGGYTRGGEDAPAYKSYQKSGCFAWRLEQPTCDEPGQVAVLEDGKWKCTAKPKVDARASTIRRTATSGRIRLQ